MDDLNLAEVRGRLVKDPEVRFTPSGAMVANFSVATDREWVADGTRHQASDYHLCVAWAKLGEVASKLEAGAPVHVTGRLQTRSWSDTGGLKRYRTEIIAASVEPLELRTPAAATSSVVALDEAL